MGKPRQVQLRRGSAQQHEAFTGAIGEITVDTTNNTLRIHDGVTTGGTILAKMSDISTSSNQPVPDYNSPTSITGITTVNQNITIPSNGIIFITFSMCNGGEIFYIDDRITFSVRDFAQSIWDYISAPIPISAGVHTMRTSYAAERVKSVVFYPFL